VSIGLCGGGRSKKKAKRREKKRNELHTWEYSRQSDTHLGEVSKKQKQQQHPEFYVIEFHQQQAQAAKGLRRLKRFPIKPISIIN
jgi:hypothetical protein